MSRFWVFEATFVINNNLLMGEVFVGATRKELVAAMQRFFAGPRANILLAEVLGAYFVDDGKVESYFDAMPFVKVNIAKETLSFDRDALAVLKPFSFVFDAEGFLASLPDRDGDAMTAKAQVELVRPIGVAGFPEHCDADLYGGPVKVGPGWWDAEPSSSPKRFDPKSRFVKARDVPMV